MIVKIFVTTSEVDAPIVTAYAPVAFLEEGEYDSVTLVLAEFFVDPDFANQLVQMRNEFVDTSRVDFCWDTVLAWCFVVLQAGDTFSYPSWSRGSNEQLYVCVAIEETWSGDDEGG